MRKQTKKRVARKSKQTKREKNDITELMLRDHKPLKRLIKTLKEPDAEMQELRPAFEEFASLLEAHAHPEQESLYSYLKENEDEEIQIEGYEGFTEHGLADELAERIKTLKNEQDWKAQVKVLAELVEHHLEEEEEEMIPDLRKELEAEERVRIGEDYLSRRAEFDIPEAAAA